jgi:hypothetical protein
MRSTTYRLIMLSTVLLGVPLAMAQAQTGSTGAMQNMAPGPVGAYSSVGQLLTAANQAIATGQTGLASQRLGWAKTKIINRRVPVTNSPQTYGSMDPVQKQINNARYALSKNDLTGARQIIDQVLASNAPELAY